MTQTIAFVQLPLLTKPELEPEETAYFTAYWDRYARIFDVPKLKTQEAYTVAEFPLWITRLVPPARDAGWTPQLLDLWQHTGPKASIPWDAVERAVAATPADCYAFSPFTANYTFALRVAEMVRRLHGKSPRMVIGGAHATALADRCLEEGFDAVVRGEGEVALGAYLRGLTSGAALSRIPGLSYRDGTERVHNPAPGGELNLVSADSFAYDLLPADWKPRFGRIYASMGCPYRCSFCADTNWIGMTPFFRQIDVLDREVTAQSKFGSDVLFVGDEVFTLRPGHAREVAKMLGKHQIKWFCQTRPNLMLTPGMPETLKTMVDNGCRHIQLGAESADDAVLEQLDKRITFAMVVEACRRAKDAGLSVLTYWMVGGPGETFETARSTVDKIEWLFEQGLTDMADYYICTPYPGTSLYADPSRYDVEIIDKGYDAWREDQPSVMRTRYLSEDQAFQLWLEGLQRLSHCMATVAPLVEGNELTGVAQVPADF